MTEHDHVDDLLEAVAGVLIRCFLIALAFLIVVFAVVVFAWDWAYRVHSSIIPISGEQFAVVNYSVLTAVRSAAFLFFLVPYVAIKMVLKKRRGR